MSKTTGTFLFLMENHLIFPMETTRQLFFLGWLFISVTPCCQLNARLHRKIAILIYVSQNVLFYIIITYRRLNTLNTNTNENNNSKRYFDCSDNVINMHFRELIFQNTKITHRTIFAVFMAIRISRFRFDVIIVYEKIGF